MTIKEICEKTGLTPDTVRYYEKAGVIPNVNRSCGGTRCYSEEDLSWLQTAACLRNAGMTVAAISEYVTLCKKEDTIEERLALLTSERKRIELQKQQLEEALTFLNYKIGVYEKAMVTGELDWSGCEEQEANVVTDKKKNLDIEESDAADSDRRDD